VCHAGTARASGGCVQRRGLIREGPGDPCLCRFVVTEDPEQVGAPEVVDAGELDTALNPERLTLGPPVSYNSSTDFAAATSAARASASCSNTPGFISSHRWRYFHSALV